MSAAPGGPRGIEPAGQIVLPGGGRALFADRSHGNLSSVGGVGAEHGEQARARLRECLGIEVLVRGYQVHGAVVGRVHADGVRRASAAADVEREGEQADVRVLGEGASQSGASQPLFRADGHAVAAPGVAAMVLSADCVPVVLGASGAVAALHAGWRGLAAGVLEEGVLALREVGGSGAIAAIVGPCAGACCYEVGEEVHAAFAGAHRRGRLIDLRAIARERLLAAGVAEVGDAGGCTICDERFFSHRREGAQAGRQGALAWLPSGDTPIGEDALSGEEGVPMARSGAPRLAAGERDDRASGP